MATRSVIAGLLLAASSLAAEAAPPSRDSRVTKAVRRAGKHTLINPLLEIEPTLEFSELRPFKHKVSELIRVHRSSGDVSHVSVYYRDLSNGPLFGINEKEPFIPASLLKVPVMMAVLKRAEEDPAFLNQVVRYEALAESSPMISTTTLRTGEFYTIEALVRSMIVDSDNGAVFLLRSLLGSGALEEVYTDLGLSIPAVRTADEPITVREYGTFFRMLYNASYLSRTNSQAALALLTESRYPNGLAAGVPSGIRVAHKFGERSSPDGGRQLHDCGIVYFIPRPYLICVMTRGREFSRMAATIADISETVFNEVSTGALKP